MLLISNPFVWLFRFRKRKGYGVHSPFAFHFITEVLEEHDAYYAYAELDAQLKWYQMFRYRKYIHMLFRLVNYVKPKGVLGVNISPIEKQTYTRHIPDIYQSTVRVQSEYVEMCILSIKDWLSIGSDDKRIKNCRVFVIKDVQKYKDIWRKIVRDRRFSVTFDLYDVGIAFTRQDLNKQNYVVNW